MHQINLDLSLEEICKIEGAAGLDLSIVRNQVTKCHFKITEYKRFYTQAVVGKAAMAAPTLLARICGTCSNAHILAAIEAVENALKITPSPQTMLLRRLIMNGLIIRDHALHLYIFVLPDLFNKDSILDFDDSNPEQHQLVHDTFEVKDAGNQLSILTGGRSVHAPLPQVGGFNQVPTPQATTTVISKLKAIRPAVLKLIKIFADYPLTQTHSIPYLSHHNPDYSYLIGEVCSSDGICIPQENYRSQLHHLNLPYSHASAYTYKDQPYFTGALARVNLNHDSLNPQTKQAAALALQSFPSRNLYHNNLAQAIEILNAIDDTLSVLPEAKFKLEPLIKPQLNSGEGFGLVEAPRGILYHHLSVIENIIKDAEILVPTGQNQLNIENDIKILVENKIKNQTLTDNLKTELEHDIEVLIRAYDPCMSCASHFLKINWNSSAHR